MTNFSLKFIYFSVFCFSLSFDFILARHFKWYCICQSEPKIMNEKYCWTFFAYFYTFWSCYNWKFSGWNRLFFFSKLLWDFQRNDYWIDWNIVVCVPDRHGKYCSLLVVRTNFHIGKHTRALLTKFIVFVIVRVRPVCQRIVYAKFTIMQLHHL